MTFPGYVPHFEAAVIRQSKVGGTAFRPSMIRSPVASINEGQWPNCVQNTQCSLNVQSSRALTRVRLFVAVTSATFLSYFLSFSRLFLPVRTPSCTGDKSENCHFFVRGTSCSEGETMKVRRQAFQHRYCLPIFCLVPRSWGNFIFGLTKSTQRFSHDSMVLWKTT